MRRALLALVLVTGLLVVGCGDESDDGDTTDSPPDPPAQVEPEPTGGFTGLAGKTYGDAKIVCGIGNPSKTAADLGIDSNVSDGTEAGEVAEAYAEAYTGEVQQAAYEGCFEGIAKAAGLGPPPGT